MTGSLGFFTGAFFVACGHSGRIRSEGPPQYSPLGRRHAVDLHLSPNNAVQTASLEASAVSVRGNGFPRSEQMCMCPKVCEIGAAGALV